MVGVVSVIVTRVIRRLARFGLKLALSGDLLCLGEVDPISGGDQRSLEPRRFDCRVDEPLKLGTVHDEHVGLAQRDELFR